MLTVTDNSDLSDTMLLALLLHPNREFDHWTLSDHVSRATHYELDFISHL